MKTQRVVLAIVLGTAFGLSTFAIQDAKPQTSIHWEAPVEVEKALQDAVAHGDSAVACLILWQKAANQARINGFSLSVVDLYRRALSFSMRADVLARTALCLNLAEACFALNRPAEGYAWTDSAAVTVFTDEIRKKYFHLRNEDELKKKELVEAQKLSEANATKKNGWIVALGLLLLTTGRSGWRFWRKFKGERRVNGELTSRLAVVKDERERFEQRMVGLQMRTHFMVAGVNTIGRFLQESPKRVTHDFVIRFARLMDYLLDFSTREEVFLSEEIETINNYIRLEEYRFERSFHFHISCASGLDTRGILVPPMVLLHVIENAVRHGVSTANGHRSIDLTLDVRFGQLVCIVRNGVSSSTKASARSSKRLRPAMGNDLVKNRLEMFGRRHAGLATIYQNEGLCTYDVVVFIPLVSTRAKSA